jgi:hypothetical protein
VESYLAVAGEGIESHLENEFGNLENIDTME